MERTVAGRDDIVRREMSVVPGDVGFAECLDVVLVERPQDGKVVAGRILTPPRRVRGRDSRLLAHGTPVLDERVADAHQPPRRAVPDVHVGVAHLRDRAVPVQAFEYGVQQGDRPEQAHAHVVVRRAVERRGPAHLRDEVRTALPGAVARRQQEVLAGQCVHELAVGGDERLDEAMVDGAQLRLGELWRRNWRGLGGAADEAGEYEQVVRSRKTQAC